MVFVDKNGLRKTPLQYNCANCRTIKLTVVPRNADGSLKYVPCQQWVCPRRKGYFGITKEDKFRTCDLRLNQSREIPLLEQKCANCYWYGLCKTVAETLHREPHTTPFYEDCYAIDKEDAIAQSEIQVYKERIKIRRTGK